MVILCIASFLCGVVVSGMAAYSFAIFILPLPDTRPGFTVVPIKPTSKMLNAAAKAMSPGARPTQKWVSVRKKHEIRYRAMIGAAPQ